MAELSQVLISSKTRGQLRPVEPQRDLLQVADLVELCFKDTLDAEGFSYLRQMRAIARGSQFLTWMYNFAEQASGMQMLGYVWEEEGRLVGNASLIPVKPLGQRAYLIANVSVHPDFRGRGIAGQLTAAAVDYARGRGVRSTWLQVRAENALAIHIYHKLGFQERARRTTWVTTPASVQPTPFTTIQIGARQAKDWLQQRAWLEQLYPPMLHWHLPVNTNLLLPGLIGSMNRFFAFEFSRQWSVYQDRQLKGVLSWLENVSQSDNLLFSGPSLEELDILALQALLTHARHKINPRQRLSLNLPTGYGDQALMNSGFTARQILIWMELPFI